MPTDHGFSPGVTDYDRQYLNLLRHRTTPTLDTIAYPPPVKLKTVADFWKHLDNTVPHSELPIKDVVLVSHGNDSGDMRLKLVAKGRERTDYDELLRIPTVAADAAAVKLPDDLRRSSPGMPVGPTTIHIRGCQIGRDTKYMKRLRDLMGDKVTVTAPRHLAAIQALLEGKRHVIDPPSHGYLECLMYEFLVEAKAPFTDRALLVDAFKKAKHKFIDGVQVPDELWEKWVPTKFDATMTPIPMPALALGATIPPAGSGSKLPKLTTSLSDGKFEHYKIPQTVNVASATKPKPADHRALILTELKKYDMFTRADRPYWEQMGFASLETFVDGQEWTPSYDAKKKLATFVGYRHYYSAQIHLCDPTVGDKKKPDTWQLIYNFYPLRSNPQLVAIEKMSTSDARLFFAAKPPP